MALVLFVLMSFVPQQSWARNAFTVEDVKADVVSSSATSARDKAVADGEAQAFSLLLQRFIVPGTSMPALPDAAKISSLVQSMDIKDEKITGARYRASISFTFDSVGTTRWLDEQQIPYSVRNADKLLLVPVTSVAGKNLLWEEHLWRKLWQHQRPAANLNWVVPLGDLRDVEAVAVEKILESPMNSATQKILADWMHRYDAGAVVLLQLEKKPAQKDRAVATILTAAPPRVIAQIEGEERDLPLRLAGMIEQEWPRYAQAETSYGLTELNVVAEISSLEDWQDLQKKLAAIPAIQSVRVRQISTRWIDMDWFCLQPPEQISAVLAAQGLVFSQNANGWSLTH
jgi:hypothetical protein